MSAVILNRIIGGVSDNRIQLLRSTLYRPHGLGTSWTALRVAMRFTMDGTASTAGVNNDIAVGLANLAAPSTRSIYWLHDYQGFTYNAASGGNANYYSPVANADYVQKAYNGSYTLTSASAAAVYPPATGSNATRRMIFVDITKGTPNYSATLFAPTGATSASVDVSANDFLLTATALTPSFTGHARTTLNSIAFDETAAALDSCMVIWTTSTTTVYLEICDLAVIQMQ